jgi:hypothetical protein
VINGWWEWLLLASRCFSSGAATITRVIAVKSSTSSDEANRSHNPKTTDTKLQSFFHDQIDRARPAAPLITLSKTVSESLALSTVGC